MFSAAMGRCHCAHVGSFPLFLDSRSELWAVGLQAWEWTWGTDGSPEAPVVVFLCICAPPSAGSSGCFAVSIQGSCGRTLLWLRDPVMSCGG